MPAVRPVQVRKGVVPSVVPGQYRRARANAPCGVRCPKKAGWGPQAWQNLDPIFLGWLIAGSHETLQQHRSIRSPGACTEIVGNPGLVQDIHDAIFGFKGIRVNRAGPAIEWLAEKCRLSGMLLRKV